MCVVCVCERERESERECVRERKRERETDYLAYSFLVQSNLISLLSTLFLSTSITTKDQRALALECDAHLLVTTPAGCTLVNMLVKGSATLPAEVCVCGGASHFLTMPRDF